jgi:hypothetical protein
MFCVRKAHRRRSLVRSGQTWKLDHSAVLFAVLETLLHSKVAWASPSCIFGDAPLPCVATRIRRALQSALIINSVFREFFEVRLAEASGAFMAFFKIAGTALGSVSGLALPQSSEVIANLLLENQKAKNNPIQNNRLNFVSHSTQLSSI